MNRTDKGAVIEYRTPIPRSRPARLVSWTVIFPVLWLLAFLFDYQTGFGEALWPRVQLVLALAGVTCAIGALAAGGTTSTDKFVLGFALLICAGMAIAALFMPRLIH